MTNIADLKTLGFSENLSKIYMSLLKMGKSRASLLIVETGLQRSVVYTCLEELRQRGLASKSLLRGVAHFVANDPGALIDEVEDRRRLAEKVASELKLMKGISNREAVVYEGSDITERVADKSLENVAENETVYFLGASKFGAQANLERLWKKYHKKRIEKKVKCKILYDRDTDKQIVADRNALDLCEARYMPFGQDLPIWLSIFGEHVAMVVPGDEPPIAFIIRSAKTAEGFRNYFEYLWSQSEMPET